METDNSGYGPRAIAIIASRGRVRAQDMMDECGIDDGAARDALARLARAGVLSISHGGAYVLPRQVRLPGESWVSAFTVPLARLMGARA
ncbi:MAG: hypothetical protein JO256_09180 [Alphaproteobacteria bacterium]|nr:hypothetical protein [Alphaproteobacteria bacterium]